MTTPHDPSSSPSSPPPPTPPVADAEFAPEPPRDELDALLREWHARPAPVAARDKLLAALEADDAKPVPGPIPFPNSRIVTVRPQMLRLAALAALFVLVGTGAIIALNSSRFLGGSRSGVMIAAERRDAGYEALEKRSSEFDRVSERLADASAPAESSSEMASAKTGAPEHTFGSAHREELARAAADMDAASDRHAAVTNAAPASPASAGAPAASTAKARTTARADSSPPATTPAPAPASPARAEPNTYGESAKSEDRAASPAVNREADQKIGTAQKTKADDAEQRQLNEQVLSPRAQRVLSPPLQDAAIRNFYRLNLTQNAANVQTNQVQGPSNDTPAAAGETHQAAQQNTANQQRSAPIPVTLRLNQFNPATSELVLRQLGVSNMRFLGSGNTIIEGDASEDWLLTLAELEFVTRVELRAVPPETAKPKGTSTPAPTATPNAKP